MPTEDNNGVPQPNHQPARGQDHRPAPEAAPEPNVNPDAALMEGHPAAQPESSPAPKAEDPPTPAPAAQPQTETVYVGNQKFELDPTAAQIVRAQQEMLQQMANQQSQPKPESDPKPDDLGIDPDLMYTDPAEYTRQVMNRTLELADSRLTTKYQQTQNRNTFFSNFYSKNEDLKASEDLVQAELNAHYDEWKDKPVSQVHDLLAEKVRSRILGYVSRYGKPGQAEPNPRTVVESGHQQPAPSVDAAPADEPKTASNILRMRRQQKRGAGG